jgi:hypothetical protein
MTLTKLVAIVSFIIGVAFINYLMEYFIKLKFAKEVLL